MVDSIYDTSGISGCSTEADPIRRSALPAILSAGYVGPASASKKPGDSTLLKAPVPGVRVNLRGLD